MKSHCWLRLTRHSWVRRIQEHDHMWKACSECGRKTMTHHMPGRPNCPEACWAGPQ